MANTDNAFGLKPVSDIGGGSYSGRTNKYCFLAATGTAAYVGSVVKMTGTADANGIAEVTANVTTADTVIGVITSVLPVSSDSTTYRVASTLRYCTVADDPDQLFEAQVSDGTFAITHVGNVADLASLTSGSTVYGNSTTEVSFGSLSASGDGTEDVLILGVVQREGNEVGEFNKVIVRLNNHFKTDASAGV